jgi:glycosyltransferase involved in cell wall biosynthesis
MKILFILPAYYPSVRYGGPIQSMHLLAKTLYKKDIEVYVITTNVYMDKGKNVELFKWVNIDDVKVMYFPSYFYENFSFSPQYLFFLLKHIKDYDLAYISPIWTFTVLAGSIACKLNKIPYIFAPHGSLYEETIKIKSYWIKKIYYFLFAKWCIENANLIHYTTEDEKEKVTRYLGIKNKSLIIPNGIDLDNYKDLDKIKDFKNYFPELEEKKYILFMGRISKKKGLNLLISAFKMILKDFPDFYLVIAGPDNEGYKKEVEKIIKKNDIEEKVIFTGMLEGEKILSAYKSAELFVLPSYSENFGMVVPEAMMCETPVIISNRVGIYKEVLEYNAGIVTNLSVGDISSGMLKVLEYPSLKSKIISNAGRLVKEKYDIDKVTDCIIGEFHRILV